MKKQVKGFTLMEVLVAIVVFSFGLLGLAGMMTISVRNNHNGYLRSQANFLAENMMDRMRANQPGLWLDKYQGDAPIGEDVCNIEGPCDFEDLAKYDMQRWAQALAVMLPSGKGNITCVKTDDLPVTVTAAESPAIWLPVPPYRGVCTVTVTWTESNQDDDADKQELVLVSKP